MIPYSERTRVLVVFGTRPEAIKMIPVIRALQDSEKFRPIVVGTGQHTDMVEDLIAASGLRLDVNLRAAEPIDGRRPSLNEIVARIMVGIDRIWSSETLPAEYQDSGRRSVHGAQVCLVHGDTSSAMAAAIAAFNLQIPVVHIEAGLRTSDLLSPFPEEGNRQLISRIAALHMAPTTTNKMNLVREGVDYDRILVTGNTSIDMLHWATTQNGGFGPGLESIEPAYLTADGGVLRSLERRLVLVTAHRRENWGGGLQNIAIAIQELCSRYPKDDFVVSMHPNPIARAPMIETLSDRENVHLVEPRNYLAFAKLMSAAHIVITDSGGIQEEAPALGTPVLVTRNTTERQEGLEAGTLRLVGTDTDTIVREARQLLDDPAKYRSQACHSNPYGDGRASERIVAGLDHIFLDGLPPRMFQNNEIRTAVARRMGLDLNHE